MRKSTGAAWAVAGRILAFALALTAVVLGRAADAPDPGLTALFETRYSTMKAAMAARDGKAITALVTADFVSEDADGQTSSSAKMIQDVVAAPRDPNKESSTTVLSVQVVGEVATVSQRYRMTTVRVPEAGAPEQHIELVAESTDTWVTQAGAWALKKTITETLDYMIDGRVVVHKVHAPRRGD